MIDPEDLIETACLVFDIPRDVLLGPSRVPHVAEARQALMLALRRRTHLSLEGIARACGRSDHTTVRYGIEQAEKRCQRSREYRSQVGALLDLPDLAAMPAAPPPTRPAADVRLRWSIASTGGIVHALAA